MKKIRFLMTAILLLCAVASPMLPLKGFESIAEAAVKLSPTKITLDVGATQALKLTGAKKITWKSSNEVVATVSKKGVVTAVGAGTAKISATVDKRKYYCTITVIGPNPYLEKADFTAKEVYFDDLSFVIPEEWKYQIPDFSSNSEYAMYMMEFQLGDNSYAQLYYSDIESNFWSYDDLKESLDKDMTEEKILQNNYSYDPNITYEILDLDKRNFDTPNGMAYRVEYIVAEKGSDSGKQVVQYTMYFDHYLISLDAEDGDDLGITDYTDFLMKSLMLRTDQEK